jgi:hypothetical protein
MGLRCSASFDRALEVSKATAANCRGQLTSDFPSEENVVLLLVSGNLLSSRRLSH